jgi:hypothetical protein
MLHGPDIPEPRYGQGERQRLPEYSWSEEYSGDKSVQYSNAHTKAKCPVQAALLDRALLFRPTTKAGSFAGCCTAFS